MAKQSENTHILAGNPIDRNQLGALDVNRWIILKRSLDKQYAILWIDL
jgi:hypothetical protein